MNRREVLQVLGAGAAGLFSEACEDCAAECDRLGDPAMKDCVEACRKCAKECRALAG